MPLVAAVHEDEVPGPGLPLDLVLPYMSPKEWLACFQASHVMADQVVRHVARTHLALRLGNSSPAGPANLPGSITAAPTAEVARSNPQVAQQLAAHAEDVTLTMQGGLATPAEWLRGSITSIRLQGVQLPASDVVASTLQLHALPRLHTLSLEECRVEPEHTPTTTTNTTNTTTISSAPTITTTGVVLLLLVFSSSFLSAFR